MAIVPAKLGQIIGVSQCVKQSGKAGKAGVNRVANRVDHGGIRQGKINEAREDEIFRHLIGDAHGMRSEPLDLGNVAPSQIKKVVRGHGRYQQLLRTAEPSCDLSYSFAEILQLAGAEYLRVAGKNLLNQRRS